MSVEQGGCVFDVKALATQISITCGPCRALVLGGEHEALSRALSLAGFEASGHDPEALGQDAVFRLPFADDSFDSVVFFGGAGGQLLAALEEIRRVTRRSLILLIDTAKVAEPVLACRRGWEVNCFDAGFRKHPLYYRNNDYSALEHDSERLFIPLEKVPADALKCYPMASLREERDLHMDMLRESGSRSDAHVVRYHVAASFIRPGDAVLDAACGLGYGTYVVRSQTRARSFIGIDASEYGIDYARLNFGGEATSFRRGMLPDCLASIPDNSIDHILCFETLEHVQDPVRLLAEFQRVLTPGGRLTCSVPHDWSDETGSDPNPFHLHVYNKARFVEELSLFFDVERLVGQTADRVKQPGGACVWLKRPRALVDIAVDQCEVEAEWLLAVVAKSPLGGHHVPYNEQVFSPEEQRVAGHALAFARDYSNPWLIRALVSMGLRTDNAALRERWAKAVWRDSTVGASDRGAALCVLAYAAFAKASDSSDVELLDCIDGYLADTVSDRNPTVLRWRVSLMYVGGLLALSSGRREIACGFFRDVVATPVVEYSPTLLTKPAEAAYLLGLIQAGEGRAAEAHRTWWAAFKQISVTLGQRLAQGYEARPPVFEIREMATALSLCGRLVAAVAYSEDLARSPGVFYDECHADSVFHLMAAEASLASLQAGKEWLESQWKASEAERARLQDSLASLQQGKEWLESQWKAQALELENRMQCIQAQQLHISGLELNLATLESKLETLEADNSSFFSDPKLAREKLSRLKRNFFFRVARKLGFFNYF